MLMMNKPSSTQCRYALLTSALQREIEQGRYAIGASLPTEATLCEQFKVSRHTVREALRQLRQMGLITSKQGSGTIVLSSTPEPRFVQSLDSPEDFLEFLRQARAEILIQDMAALCPSLAEICDMPNCRQLWLHIRLLRYWGEPSLPTLLSDAYVDAKYSGVKDNYNTSNPISETIEQMYGVKVGMFQQDIQAIALSKEQAELLQTKPNTPALQTIRRCYAENGELLVLSCNIAPAERYTYSTRMQVTSAQR